MEISRGFLQQSRLFNRNLEANYPNVCLITLFPLLKVLKLQLSGSNSTHAGARKEARAPTP